MPPAPEEDFAAAAAELLSRAVRLPSVNPPGDERPVAELFVNWLRGAGIEARVIATPSAGAPAGRAAAWARVPGTGKLPPLVLLSHLDVVPADPAAWMLDPFAGSVVGGHVVGRGALDAKGVAVVHLFTLLEVARRAVPLDRDIIFLATPDEETGGRDGSGYLVEHHRELLGGAAYLLTEGGGILVHEDGSPDVWGITIAEKIPCWLRLSARGRGGHGSTATPDGAIPRLVEALGRLHRLPSPLRVIPEVERMFRHLAPGAAPEDRAPFARLGESLRGDPEFRRRFLAAAPRAALVRDTLTSTVLRAGSSTNVIPSSAYAELDARLLPGAHCGEFADRVQRTIDDPKVTVAVKLTLEGPSAPIDTALFDAIARVAAERDPRTLVVPRVIAGFTDAHYYRELGIVSYGFVPRRLPPRETRGIHGPNERIAVRNLEFGVRTLVRILEALNEGEATTAAPEISSPLRGHLKSGPTWTSPKRP